MVSGCFVCQCGFGGMDFWRDSLKMHRKAFRTLRGGKRFVNKVTKLLPQKIAILVFGEFHAKGVSFQGKPATSAEILHCGDFRKRRREPFQCFVPKCFGVRYHPENLVAFPIPSDTLSKTSPENKRRPTLWHLCGRISSLCYWLFFDKFDNEPVESKRLNL